MEDIGATLSSVTMVTGPPTKYAVFNLMSNSLVCKNLYTGVKFCLNVLGQVKCPGRYQ